jgi:Plant transposon protein.
MMFVAKLINKNINKWIAWPTGERALKNIQDFNNIPGNKLKGIFGCLDGSHIRICKTKVDNSYINRHQYPSINLQAICDSKKKFLYVFCGWPGSAHDSRVWQHSPLHNNIEEKRHEMLPLSSYIISDSAYELRTFNITPYKESAGFGRPEKLFNQNLSKIRVLIEQAFGRLKGIFRRVKHLECKKVENSSQLVVLACILHNIVIDSNVETNYEEDLDNEDYNDPVGRERLNNERQTDRAEAVRFRDELKNNIINQ